MAKRARRRTYKRKAPRRRRKTGGGGGYTGAYVGTTVQDTYRKTFQKDAALTKQAETRTAINGLLLSKGLTISQPGFHEWLRQFGATTNQQANNILAAAASFALNRGARTLSAADLRKGVSGRPTPFAVQLSQFGVNNT
jgi:hypothetical protein